MAANRKFRKVFKIFKLDRLQQFQIDTLENLLKKKDVFLSVKTGGGKIMCYQAFQPAWCDIHSGFTCTVLVVSPLISIIKEQCEFLSGFGFSSTYIGKDNSEESAYWRESTLFLFASPELLLSTQKWRDMMMSAAGKCIKLLVVDEAHTVLQWGETDSDQEAFRSWFGQLGELRSMLECPTLLITATASTSARKQLQQKFCMVSCFEIIDNPDRNNIKLFVAIFKSTEPLENIFYFLLHMITEHEQKSDRFVIFCTSIKTCSDIYTAFRLKLEQAICHVQMYHSSTTEIVKEQIKNDLSNPDGNVRILIATSAAGMGVNFASVKGVVNFGPPKDMDSFVLQFGRAGRDGSQSSSLLLYSAKQCKKLDSDMQDYISNNTVCRRNKLLSYYNATSSDLIKHACCDICAKSCQCSSGCPDIVHPYFGTRVPDNCSESDETDISSDNDITESE